MAAAQALETTPLFPKPEHGSFDGCDDSQAEDPRLPLYRFLEAKTPAGRRYEHFTIFLISISVVTFILSSLFLPEYNDSPIADKCGGFCDAIFFGNYDDNALAWLGIGATSVVEMFVVAIFSVDYGLRFYTADLLDPKYSGLVGRLRFVPSFFSLVDLASTVPFYVDSFLLPNTDLAASTFLRMFRLLRMLKVEGRLDLAIMMVDDVFVETRGILGTALFVGATVWCVLSTFYYIAERQNLSMIYCGSSQRCQDIDTSLCEIDQWGIVDCSAAGCKSDAGVEECYNLYRSIVTSSYWTLINLFGEFPLFDQHSAWGKVVGTVTCVFAAAVFALPVGIFATGFEDQISKRRKLRTSIDGDLIESHHKPGEAPELIGDEPTSASHAKFEIINNHMIVICALAFALDTVSGLGSWHFFLGFLQFISALFFTAEYLLLMYSARNDQRYRGMGLLTYACSFLRLVDVLSIAPYWLSLMAMSPSLFAKAFLLLRILRFEKYSRAFTTFDDVIREHAGVLAITLFSAILVWIFFASILYFTERGNPDEEMAYNYRTIPDSMWITLLNLSGECPLGHYSVVGKVLIGVIGLFATAIFGVPIGLLGAGFEEMVEEAIEDTPDEERTALPHASVTGLGATERACYEFVNGIGSKAARWFEISIYLLIGVTVTIGIVQTVEGHETWLSSVESLAVVVFTAEYAIRLVGAGADPEFASSNGFVSRVRFFLSFYSVIDLLAIVPYYLAVALPGSWVDDHDGYFRMLRLMRLLKLDKHVPSISLIDDVARLKRNVLMVAGYAAGTLWILFNAAMYVVESDDNSQEIDPLPLYGCVDNCTMAVRFKTFFSSFPLTGIHLTGDFPLIEYGWPGRFVLFFMVIAAVGVVSIPSGVIASGFAEIVQSKSGVQTSSSKAAGDDWYDIRWKELEGVEPHPSRFGPRVDALQFKAKEYLDGTQVDGVVVRTKASAVGRLLFVSLIVANVLAVILESIPEIDYIVGNERGNAFDAFEAWSVFFFSLDYALRLFSAQKSRDALYSPWVYSQTFFGIVDLLSILPWYIEAVLASSGKLSGDEARVFRVFRIFRILQLEDFVVAFSRLDNVYRASKGVLKATGLMALIIWIGSSALFFIFESDNPNFRECDGSVPLIGEGGSLGCYDFESTAACNAVYPGMCSQTVFTNMPSTLFYVAVFLGGEWGVVDFTWRGKIVCIFLCVAGIALYSIPVGTLFDSFGAVIGLVEEEDEEEDDEEK